MDSRSQSTGPTTPTHVRPRFDPSTTPMGAPGGTMGGLHAQGRVGGLQPQGGVVGPTVSVAGGPFAGGYGRWVAGDRGGGQAGTAFMRRTRMGIGSTLIGPLNRQPEPPSNEPDHAEAFETPSQGQKSEAAAAEPQAEVATSVAPQETAKSERSGSVSSAGSSNNSSGNISNGPNANCLATKGMQGSVSNSSSGGAVNGAGKRDSCSSGSSRDSGMSEPWPAPEQQNFNRGRPCRLSLPSTARPRHQFTIRRVAEAEAPPARRTSEYIDNRLAELRSPESSMMSARSQHPVWVKRHTFPTSRHMPENRLPLFSYLAIIKDLGSGYKGHIGSTSHAAPRSLLEEILNFIHFMQRTHSYSQQELQTHTSTSQTGDDNPLNASLANRSEHTIYISHHNREEDNTDAYTNQRAAWHECSVHTTGEEHTSTSHTFSTETQSTSTIQESTTPTQSSLPIPEGEYHTNYMSQIGSAETATVIHRQRRDIKALHVSSNRRDLLLTYSYINQTANRRVTPTRISLISSSTVLSLQTGRVTARNASLTEVGARHSPKYHHTLRE
ncbi:hypothetical protein C7M84_017813 [Penaeus vannamei]|uniref:Uncharacterized protein n=1 Tax=Penaeus vannamei TaxID=6689 RepID=A0A3R7PZA5_PENVA|nr:hypothetical protein C7M84_017813 [Penaeus vannamei]